MRKNYSSVENRTVVHEVKVGNVVLEITKKVDGRSGRVYFDYRTVREFVKNNEDTRGPYCQQRDLRDNIVACVKCMEWISQEHKAIKKLNVGEFYSE
ncbi:hypothetical protein N8Z24_00200 [bacterium]|nr:hypothetical protein [bacterium]